MTLLDRLAQELKAAMIAKDAERLSTLRLLKSAAGYAQIERGTETLTDAEVVALIYRQRWLIEIFFRFFKHVLGCRHLLSAQPGGIAIQAYCALIACLLITLWTGRKPTQRTYEMLGWYFLGWASAEELSAHLDKLKTNVAH